MNTAKKINLSLKFAGNTSRADNFYEYLSGEMSLPDILVIGNDCKHKHGINGKTVRRVVKNKVTGASGTGVCIKCEQKKSSLRKEVRNKNREQKTKMHKRAMDLYDEQQHKDDGFLI